MKKKEEKKKQSGKTREREREQWLQATDRIQVEHLNMYAWEWKHNWHSRVSIKGRPVCYDSFLH